MTAITEFKPEQLAKARRYRDSMRDASEDWQLLDELDAELGENLESLLDLVENEPVPRSSAWTPALIKQAKRISELRPLTAPSNDGAKETLAELQKLKSELQAALGTRSANELQSWCEQQEKRYAELRTELGKDLADFYELMVGHGAETVVGLQLASGLSQPTVSRRLAALEHRGLATELPPVQRRWEAVIE